MSAAYESLLALALPHHNDGIERLRSEFGLGEYERWDFNQDTGVLAFSDFGIAKLYATAQVMGSHSMSSDTWLWAWANPSVLPNLCVAAGRVREYGAAHSITELTEPKFEASEDIGWRLAATGAYLTQGIAIYRCPVPIGALFLSIVSAQRAS